MHSKIYLYILFTFLSSSILAQEADCSRTTEFGAAEICLPKMEGYQECYLYPVVKELADRLEVPANRVLGFYLNDEIHAKKDSLGLISFDDFFKVYGTKQIEGYEADREFLNEMQGLITGNFISANWEQVEKEVDQIGLDLEIGVPKLIKVYNYNKDSFTTIMLAKYQIEGAEPYTLAMTINGLLINQRLIWMAYYLRYEGEETITRLQKNSDLILSKFLESEE